MPTPSAHVPPARSKLESTSMNVPSASRAGSTGTIPPASANVTSRLVPRGTMSTANIPS